MKKKSKSNSQEKDQLFKAESDWYHNAMLNVWSNNLSVYADGYKKAADALVEHIKNNRHEIDFLVFPVVFLYRQYIELRLKDLIINGSELLDIFTKLPTHHKIGKLWQRCKPLLKKIYKDSPFKDLNEIENYIEQFAETDPLATAFRYPTDKEGNPSLPHLSHINLRHLFDIIQKISTLLDGAGMGIDAELDMKREVEFEHRE